MHGEDGQPHTARGERPDAHSASEEAVAEAAGAELTGLHAKLYVAERRSHVRVLTAWRSLPTVFEGFEVGRVLRPTAGFLVAPQVIE